MELGYEYENWPDQVVEHGTVVGHVAVYTTYIGCDVSTLFMVQSDAEGLNNP
jgi:hypothetical protein